MTKRILSSTVGALLTATVFLVVPTGAALAHEHITQDEFEQAVRDGKLKNTGLKLTDSARGIFKALAAANGDHSGGADLVLIGMEVTFSMHDLEAVRDKKGEFLVTVVGGSGDDFGDEEADTEKNYKVKKKHLDDLGLKQLKR